MMRIGNLKIRLIIKLSLLVLKKIQLRIVPNKLKKMKLKLKTVKTYLNSYLKASNMTMTSSLMMII